MTIWTEGVCGDGAAILRDGKMVPIEEVLRTLNASADEIERLRAALKKIAGVLWRHIDEGHCGARAVPSLSDLSMVEIARQALNQLETVK